MSTTWGQPRPDPRPLATGPPGPAVPHSPLPRCPQCKSPLDGGPVASHCPACSHGVMAADIPAEYGSRS